MIKSTNYAKYYYAKSKQLTQIIRCFNINPKQSRDYNYTHHQQPEQPLLQSLLSAIKTCNSITCCKVIHGSVIKCFSYSDGFIGDCLLSLYSKLGCFNDAHHLFEEMPHKDAVSWNSWITLLSRSGYFKKSFEMFRRMIFEMGTEPNEVTIVSMIWGCTEMGGFGEGVCVHGLALKMGLLCDVKVIHSLINMYGMSGYMDSACYLFETMLVRNLVSWNSLIKIHARNGFGEEGINFVKSMRRAGVSPDQATIVTSLQGCKDICIGNLADAMHGYIITTGFDEDIIIMTTLISIYTKSGRLCAALEVFRGLKEPDRIAWTAVLAGYALHGYGREAVELFDAMARTGELPDHVIFTHLLNACSHSGLVEEGKRYFEIMTSVYSVEPRLDHYSCMVDLLGRSGELMDAHSLIKSMPMEPTADVWGSLLNACKIHGNVDLGKEVAERLFALNPTDSTNYVMLSGMYSEAGRWSDALKTRKLMEEKFARKTAGCSFLELGH